MRRRRLFGALVVSVAVAAIEVTGGFRAQSLGLVADAVHAGTDALAICVMLLAVYAGRRIEMLAAVFNGVLLLAITGLIAYGALQRLAHPLHPVGPLMVGISALALGGNLIAAYLLFHGVRASITIRSAFLHVAADALGSSAVLIGGLLITWTHRAWLDPCFSLLVCAVVVVGVADMLREARSMNVEKPSA